jgi:2-polyprenyl-3-methyl-5-hydroxy-6-metoxy-1,4-benzoquinol methylase
MLKDILPEHLQGVKEFAQLLKNWAELEGEGYFIERINTALDFYEKKVTKEEKQPIGPTELR